MGLAVPGSDRTTTHGVREDAVRRAGIRPQDGEHGLHRDRRRWAERVLERDRKALARHRRGALADHEDALELAGAEPFPQRVRERLMAELDEPGQTQ